MKNRTLHGLALAAGLVFAWPAAAQAQPAGLVARLSAAKSSLRGAESLNVVFTLTNRSQETLHILPWHTPLAGFDGEHFVVTRDGQAVPYEGPIVKRAEPGPEHYLTLEPGAAVAATVNLAEAYDFTRPGRYAITLRTELVDVASGALDLAAVAAREERSGRALVSNTLTLSLTSPRLAVPLSRRAEESQLDRAGDNAFSRCSETEKKTLTQARTAAHTLATDSASHLDSATSTDAQYKLWFGAHTATRFAKVKNNFGKIETALADEEFTFTCGSCSAQQEADGVIAFVVAAQPYKVTLCSGFWKAPATGTDSQAGIVLHETSHFDAVAGTRDHKYGQTKCKQLAKDEPDTAIKNADSYEYFAETLP